MRKGFTLIELMAVIVIISLVCLLTFPNIVNQIKKSKDANKNNVEKIVVSSAKKYVNDNIDKYSEQRDYCISVEELVDNDYLKEDIVNDEDNNLLDWYVKVSYGNDFEYEITKECLPYTTLDYIESTGTQYIDTGYKINYLNKIEFKIQDSVFPSSGADSLYGAGDSATSNIIALYINYTQAIGYRISSSGYNDFPVGDVDKLIGISTITVNNGSITLDNENNRYNYSYDNKECYTNQNCYIFWRNQPNFSNNMAKVKLYYFKIYDVDKLVRDFIPVLDPDGVACLYDKVEDKYYYNQGTGEFLQG